MQKHFHNYGRFNLSVAQSSWDTWLDGYAQGAPYRKTSIYDEGNLVAFMLDIIILKSTQNKRSLKDVCRVLYNEFGKKNKGYSENDIIKLCEEAAGISLKEFFKKYVYGTEDFEPMLNECFEYVGLEIQKNANVNLNESNFGFKAAEQNQLLKISSIAPYSPAWKAGLSIGDDVLSINGHEIKNDLNNLPQHFSNHQIELKVVSAGKTKTISVLSKRGLTYFDSCKIVFKNSVSMPQKDNYSCWLLEN